MADAPPVSEHLYRDADHEVIWFGRHDPTQERGLPSNQFLIVDGGEGMLLDPGGYHVFDAVQEALCEYIDLDKITRIFISHQDPDVCGGLSGWLEVLPRAEVVISDLWERFIAHLGLPVNPTLRLLADDGGSITLASGSALQFVPAHFLHSAGNFQVYDRRSGILFSGDVGASVVEPDEPHTVRDFSVHARRMLAFHQRYMSSNAAVRRWLVNLRGLELKLICPQHGAFFDGDTIGAFLAWLRQLDVGIDHMP